MSEGANPALIVEGPTASVASSDFDAMVNALGCIVLAWR
jgi:hypothetical protein